MAVAVVLTAGGGGGGAIVGTVLNAVRGTQTGAVGERAVAVAVRAADMRYLAFAAAGDCILLLHILYDIQVWPRDCPASNLTLWHLTTVS